MSKIICDVCGTSYPETANQCPICGCVRPSDAVTVKGDTNEVDTGVAGTYTYVKGGRFSKTNVKKRNQGKPAQTVAAPQKETAPKKQGKNDTGMIITVLALLVAIVAIVIYIAVRFFLPGLTQQGKDPLQNAGSAQQTVNTTEGTLQEIPCTGLELSDTVVEFDKAGAGLLLNVTPIPADTTDEITYVSSDEGVATVSADGKVIAVGGGEAIITITCGTATAECRVVSTIEALPEETTEPTYSTDDFKFNREDFTLNNYGDTWTLYKGEIPADVITWTTDDEKIATIKDGVVTAVGSGTTTVYGEYGDVKLSCVVRCAETVKAPAETQAPVEGSCKISHEDVTLSVGKSFVISLRDEQGNKIDATWISANSEICTVSKGEVKAVGKGTTKISATVDGVTYSCIVRVS